MADNKMADQAEQQKKGEVLYTDEEGKTQSRKALDTDEDDNTEAPKPLGTDPAALGSDGKPQFMTHEDAQKAVKDGTTL
jgi:hypothetical protein